MASAAEATPIFQAVAAEWERHRRADAFERRPGVETGRERDHGMVVPAGKLLVLGDHRGNSFDGRFFGFVDAEKVYGRAVAVYYRRGDGFGWRQL